MQNPFYQASSTRYEGSMTYRRAGQSGILLPAISLGLWQNFGSESSFDNARKMALYALDHGIVHYDLANNYGPVYGSAEENFGRIMERDLRPYRDELFISTKAGYDMWWGPYGNWGSRKYLTASLDQSLKRMKLDYVDIFYTHRFDPETPLEETLQALVDIERQGKALYVGVSRYPLEATEFALRYLKEHDTPCLLFQDRYSMLDRRTAESGVMQKATDMGAGFVVFSALAQGLLTDRYLHGIPQDSRMARQGTLKSQVLTPELMECLQKLHQMAKERGQTLSEMALAWVLNDLRVTSVIIGASSVEQISQNLQALRSSNFSPEELKTIDRLTKGKL